MGSPSVMWFRRDLRTADHPALATAVAEGDGVVPLFVDDPVLRSASGRPRLDALDEALRALDRSLGGALVVRHGDPADVVPAVAAEVGAESVFVTRDHGPYGRRRDTSVAERLVAAGRRLRGIGSNYVVDPGTVLKADDTPYQVFTPFFRVWSTEAGAQPVDPVDDADWVALRSDPWPDESDATGEGSSVVRGPVTEAAAHELWSRFLDGAVDRYHEQRNLPGVEGTSRLSVHLKWGTVHPRTLLADLRDRGGLEPDGHRVFASELAWREFYADVLFQQPATAWTNLNRKMDAMVVDTDAAARERFARWCEGRTGYPIVDAGMRELAATGWMHNRVRMIVASFLVKDLHLPWQWGARYFMAHLVDGDLASNSHGWQWTAGTGTDAAPYFRVFNPTAQAERYDPDGAYVARWVPELGSADEVAPIVDHAAERDEALERYRAVTGR